MAELAIVRTNGREVVFIDGLNFINEVIDGMVSGDEEARKICPYSGQPKDPNQWIDRNIFLRAEREKRGKGLKIVRAVQKAFVQAGGIIAEQPLRPSRIDNGLFHEIVDVGIGQKAEKSEITVEEIHEHLVVLYPKEDHTILGTAAAIACKVVEKQVETDKRHKQEWQDAKRSVEMYYKKNPNNFFRPVEEIVNEIFLTEKSRLNPATAK